MKNILQYFELTVRLHPNKAAFFDSGRHSTFSETMTHAKSIATALLPFGRQRPVAVLIDKSCNCIDCMLGALYANFFYTVIDVKSPEERIGSILNTLQNPVIVADANTLDLAKKYEHLYPVLSYEDLVDTSVDESALLTRREEMVDLDIAYVLFTSGSTGRPKGTVIQHRSLLSYVDWVTAEFGFDENTVFGSQTPLYFSMSVTDFYSTIKCGCAYHMIPRSLFSFPVSLVQYLNENKVNTIYWVPTALSILSTWKVFDVVKPSSLRTVLFAGEEMPSRQLNYWMNSLENVKFANLFGPTEATDICSFYVIDRPFSDSERIPIGRHCDNCNVIVIKEDGTEASVGEEGELYIRSSFVASGYYDDPEKTGAAFIQNPLNRLYPEIVYKSGDLVKYNEAGELMFLSRVDHQIKRSGYRIELGEIEAAANSVSGVKGCACVYDKEQQRIVLFYEGKKSDRDRVIEQVKAQVPVYMFPDMFIRIKELPKNANGKIDRIRLLNIYKESGGSDDGKID